MAIQRLPLVDFLRKEGFVNDEQLEEAQKVAKQTNRENDLGQVLLELGHVGEREVLRGKAQEMGFTFVDLDRIKIDESALNVVPERIVKMHTAIPVRKESNNLWVAMTNPNNLQAIDDIQLASGLRVRPAMAMGDAIEDAIAKHYTAAESKNGEPASKDKGSGGDRMSTDVRGMIAQAQANRDADIAGGPKTEEQQAEQMAEQAPIIQLANAIIQQAIQSRSSDVHIEPQVKHVRVRYRIDGVLMEAMAVPRNLMPPLISRFKIMADMNIAERRIPQDGRIEIRTEGKEYDLRVSAIPTPFGEKIVCRILDKGNAMIGLGKLGFNAENQAIIEELTAQPNGMFLCTGPTGSGKTTTQYSVLHKLNTVEVNIITIEDPIEYQLGGIAQVQVNKKAGLTFATALRSFLRQDPDIMMVGEMRDLETAEIAIEASLTGHLVLSTLHTNDAPSATTRMIDMGVEPYLITATVIGVMAQRLSRKIDQSHKEAYEVPASDLRRFGFEPESEDQTVTLYRGIPHEENRQTGYRGRIGIHEMMVMNEELAELIVRRAPVAELKRAAKTAGMHELREDGLEKVLAGITDPQEVMRVVFTAGF